MNDLVYLKHDEAMTDSLTVAESFNKDHGKVLRAIDTIINDSSKNWVQCFKKSSYKDGRSAWRITEQAGQKERRSVKSGNDG